MKKQVTQLAPGDIIDPPAGEKCWLWTEGKKRRYTVTGTKPGKRTKTGQFIKIEATCPSPYDDEKPFKINCQMLETKTVKLHNEA